MLTAVLDGAGRRYRHPEGGETDGKDEKYSHREEIAVSKTMTSRERFLSTLNGEIPDLTPTLNVAALTTVELQRLTGCSMPEVHQDPDKLVRLLYANHEVLGFDAVTFLINYFNLPAALGCEMDWGNESKLPIYTSNPWKEYLLEAPSTGDLPESPRDVFQLSYIKTCIEAIATAKKLYGHNIGVVGKVMGPFSMAQAMCGVENVLTAVMEIPDQLRRIVDLCAGMLADFANGQIRAGADAICIGEGGAGANMLSPAQHDFLLTAAHRTMAGRIEGPTIMHICGDIRPRLELLGQSGISCFHFDWEIEPKMMKRISAGKFLIAGNINTSDLLLADPEAIAKQTADNLEAGTDIISPGCAVSPKCPNRNFAIIGKTIKTWRRPDEVTAP